MVRGVRENLVFSLFPFRQRPVPVCLTISQCLELTSLVPLRKRLCLEVRVRPQLPLLALFPLYLEVVGFGAPLGDERQYPVERACELAITSCKKVSVGRRHHQVPPGKGE